MECHLPGFDLALEFLAEIVRLGGWVDLSDLAKNGLTPRASFRLDWWDKDEKVGGINDVVDFLRDDINSRFRREIVKFDHRLKPLLVTVLPSIRPIARDLVGAYLVTKHIKPKPRTF